MGKVLIVVVVVVLVVYTVFDVLAADRSRVRLLPKPVWVLVALVPILGVAGWLALGRPVSHNPPPVPPRPRVVGPDDDPDFLWKLQRRPRPPGADEDPGSPGSAS
ncbi:MAG: PLDc N-terminal domain-containing protein [Nocardioidaceae bacterium]